MSTILYIVNAEKIAKKKLKNYEEAIEKRDSDSMFGGPPHHWTDSALTSMGLMAVMGIEFMLCAFLDLCLLTLLLIIIYG